MRVSEEKNIEIQFFKIFPNSQPEVILNHEHSEYWWFTPEEALSMNLTEDFDIIIKEIYWLKIKT